MQNIKNVALLCDYGLDDAIATLFLLENSDAFNCIDIIPVAGNFPLDKCFVNAKRLLSNCNYNLTNVRIVDTSSIKQNFENIPEIHGADGMGNVISENFTDIVPVISYDDWIKEVTKGYSILSLGPCTVTLDILRKCEPSELILMAGNINQIPNYKGYEFNHGLDINSFAECVKYPHFCVTLDTCHCDMCDLNKINVDGDDLFYELLCSYHKMCIERKDKYASVYDLTAVVKLLHPERFDVTVNTDKDGNNISVLRYVSNLPIIN